MGTLILSFMMQLLAIIAGLKFMEPYLLSQQFDSWPGLLREPTDWAPIVHATWVSACYAVPATLWAFLAFLRRDVAG